jgi:hypothetical protein
MDLSQRTDWPGGFGNWNRPLLHSMGLEDVAAQCAAGERTDLQVCVAPLKIPGGTGSPVAPICVL